MQPAPVGVPTADSEGVSILTDSWESVQRRGVGAEFWPTVFQSSPTPGSRCNGDFQREYPADVGVSILTDSWESVQLVLPVPGDEYKDSFNPHRLLGVGATRKAGSGRQGRTKVSILTDSWESVQRFAS